MSVVTKIQYTVGVKVYPVCTVHNMGGEKQSKKKKWMKDSTNEKFYTFSERVK